MRALTLLLGIMRSGAGSSEADAAASSSSTLQRPTAHAATLAAIKLAGTARDSSVTRTLLNHLTGEEDGVPKDGRHVYALYLALGNYAAAASTALIIARAETDAPGGSFKTAHALLFEAHGALTAAGAHVPADLMKSLSLLHSYLLVKRLIAASDHEGGARMVARVAKNISRFPSHTVPILTSAVVQCQRGNMKGTAFELACTLMSPSHREGVREDLRKKIESMVRRPTNEEDAIDMPTPCPFCDAPVPSYTLSCSQCQSIIPFCIITGKHMTVSDCSQCPSCRFPALLGPLSQWAGGKGGAEGGCTMCSAPIAPQSVTLLRDPAQFLKAAAGGGKGEAAAAAAAAATAATGAATQQAVGGK